MLGDLPGIMYWVGHSTSNMNKSLRRAIYTVGAALEDNKLWVKIKMLKCRGARLKSALGSKHCEDFDPTVI